MSSVRHHAYCSAGAMAAFIAVACTCLWHFNSAVSMPPCVHLVNI